MKMNKKGFAITAGIGCAVLVILMLVVIPAAFLFPENSASIAEQGRNLILTANPGNPVNTPSAAELSINPSIDTNFPSLPDTGAEQDSLSALYSQLHPGVVNVQVFTQDGNLESDTSGSGFIYSAEGTIVTSDHLLDDASRVSVIFHNGVELEAQIVGRDASSDLAVLKVYDLPEDTKSLNLGDSDQVEVGEWVIAIGNPSGLGTSLSAGIVSGVGGSTPLEGRPFSIPLVIRIDKTLHPGFTGGPLFNLQGQVIGMAVQRTANDSQSSLENGVAVPSNMIRRLISPLIKEGSYQWPWLGIEGINVNPVLMEANSLDTLEGIYILSVSEQGPAGQSGIRGAAGTNLVEGVETPVEGDVILEVDGKPVADLEDLLVAVSLKEPGDQIELGIFRNGEHRRMTLTLSPRPQDVSNRYQ